MKPAIVLVSTEFPPSAGGIGNHAWNLSLALKDLGFDVVIVTDSKGGSLQQIQKFDDSQNFKIVRIKRLFPFYFFSRIYKTYRLTNSLTVIMVSGRFSLWIGAFLKLLGSRATIIGVLHGSELNLSNRLLQSITNFSLGRLDTLVAVSTFTKNLIYKKKLRDRSVVIPNAILLDEFQKAGNLPNLVLDGDPTLITIGNLTPRKGQHRVIKVLPSLVKRFPNIAYHMIGLPTNKHELMTLGNQLGVSERLHFYGKIDDRQRMLQVCMSAKIFIMLSENQKSGDVEGFGIAILEANALGIPAIGARGCGIEDAIKNGVNGILVDGNDFQEIETAVAEICANWNNFSLRAKEWAEAHTWTKLVSGYIQLIN